MPESTRPSLTPTQWLVLERLALGESNKAIAVALGLTTNTVGHQLGRISRQVPRDPALSKRAAMTTWYLREGRALREEEERRGNGQQERAGS